MEQRANALGETHRGRATFYDAKRMGACSLEPGPGELLVGAMNRTQYALSGTCGACAEVEGPKGTARVRIADLCPGCKVGDLDLSREAFARVAPLGKGRVPVRWRFVPCDVQGPLHYRFKEGSTRWWAALQVRNHRVPVQKVEWWKGGAWVELKRKPYNYFITPTAMGSGPVRLRVTATDGQVREDTLPAIRAGRTFVGAVQFD
ncbi:MAG: hypothetical protein L0Y66_05295 [Myxococcaceae bacterium]|nr:hypothetical protein [Myxococcaceae bacterium]